eukprot:3787677-Pyramimonas_sp.AAC.1
MEWRPGKVERLQTGGRMRWASARWATWRGGSCCARLGSRQSAESASWATCPTNATATSASAGRWSGCSRMYMRRGAALPRRGHGPTSRAHKAAGAATCPPGSALPMSSARATRTTKSKRRATRARSTPRT